MSVECPWCAEEVILTADSICPLCMHEVLPEHVIVAGEGADANDEPSSSVIEQAHIRQSAALELVAHRFRCPSCGGGECSLQETALVTTAQDALSGPSTRMYLLASCKGCGRVETYDPAMLGAGGDG